MRTHYDCGIAPPSLPSASLLRTQHQVLLSMPTTGWTPASVQGVDEEQSFPKSDAEQTEHLGRCLWHYQRSLANYLDLPDGDSLQWIVCGHNVVARLQSGPTCGLMALRMAVETLSSLRDGQGNKHTGDQSSGSAIVEEEMPGNHQETERSRKEAHGKQLLGAAVAAGVTLKGEMFSAVEYTEFANRWYGPGGKGLQAGSLQPLAASCHAFPRSGRLFARLLLTASEKDVSDADLACPSLLAVPYDAAANHEPCLKNGFRAHWGLAKGVAIPFLKDSPIGNIVAEHPMRTQQTSSDVTIRIAPDAVTMSRIIEKTWGEEEDSGEDVETIGRGWMTNRQEKGIERAGASVRQGVCSTSSLFVIVQQSKSKHQAAYPFEMVLASNANLHDIETDRKEDFHMPNGMNDLRDHLVVIQGAQPH